MRLRWIGLLFITLSGLTALPVFVHSTPSTQDSTGQSNMYVSGSSPNNSVFENNLLTNPSFEGAYRSDPPSSLMAEGWTSWFREPRPTDHRPEWNEEVLLGEGKVSWRVRHGDKAQKMFSSFSTHEGGFYQQVNVVPGTELEFSVWVEVWSSDCDKPCKSQLEPGTVCPSQNTHGNYRVSVGIDPAGGTDPLASKVQWREYRLRWDIPYDVWNRLSITATAQANQVTVFTRGWAEFDVKHNDSYWEDAKLAYVTPPELPNKNYLPLVLRNFEATPVATPTPTVTLTPTATPSATPTLTPTPIDTVTPTPTATGVTPTSTPTTAPACEDITQNGSFEGEGGWTFQSGVPYPPDYSTDRAAEGVRSLRLGAPPDSDNSESWSAASQAISLPATPGSATLSFSYFPESTDLRHDYFEVRLLDQSGAPISYIIHPVEGQSNAQEWLTAEFDLTPYAGQVIQIYFNVYNDGKAGMARVYLDDVRIEVCGATSRGISLQAAGVQPPQLHLLQDVPFGQVHFTWVRYGKRTPNVNWVDCQNPTDVEVEWIQVVNDGNVVNLKDWTLENSEGVRFTLPDFTIGAGESIRIWTDTRENGPNDLFMNRSEPMWNDTTGRATLRFANGDLATGSLCWDLPTGGYPFACPEENP